METQIRNRLRENWLTRSGNSYARELTFALLGFLFLGAAAYLQNFAGLGPKMSATPEQVFVQGEYYRLFTTMLAHGDLGHVLSNALLFVPFSYFLLRHFSPVLFPTAGILAGALTNFVVLLTMPENTSLVGASGLVYWMGATWLTLFWLIDKRDRPAIRLGKVFMVGGVLFVPEVLKPEVSHAAHTVGLLLGIVSGYVCYAWNRSRIQAAEVWEHITIAPEPWEEAYNNDQASDSGTLALLPGVIMDNSTQVAPAEEKNVCNSS